MHEARGLDVLPSTVHKFRSNGDAETAALLEDVIYAVSRVASGSIVVKVVAYLLHTTVHRSDGGTEIRSAVLVVLISAVSC